jgi:tousled-like kinase
MNMLGRGGFSEVYKAYDTVEMREVACKLHQLSPQWGEERKRTYVRHAARECSIHKQLRHPAVVRLIDVFEVDKDSFCTVLELCTGDDLDARLKAHGAIPEREARAILAQVFAGLAYLSGGPRRVIHYDLKPGNILFDAAGRVKITDFGLSKVMEERAGGGVGGMSGDSGMELTSQGAGTYWYLPPECFETGPAPPKISSKVDTWSCGVILYQMLFGRRPFGHDQSQEQILHSGTIRNAQTVEFPAKPSISAECKAFIQRCLAYRQADRPDVPTAAADPWMTYAKPASAATAAANE